MVNRMVHLLNDAMDHFVPLSVTFELTNRCNEDCKHCYVDLGDVDGQLGTDEVKRILQELRDAGTFFLTFSGGEIFTRKDINELIREARRLGFSLRLFTNATLMKQEHFDLIAEVGVTAVEISVYAGDAETHDGITRIPGSHERTLAAIRKLREMNVHVVLKAPILEDNASAYASVIDFAREVGAEYRFDPTLVARYDLDDQPLCLRMKRADLLNVCTDPELGLAIEPGSGSTPDPDQSLCATARRVALISARGRVYPCSQRFPPAGSLREHSFAEIWSTSPLLLRLRALSAQDLPHCSTCSSNSFCGRCSLDALLEDGDFFGASSWACQLAEVRQEAYEKGGVTMRQNLGQRFGGITDDC